MQALFSAKILTIIMLSILMFACNGQKSNEKPQQVNSESPPNPVTERGIQTPAWPNPYQDQISQVVRMMFQDSKGHIWFGTQNGAFKFNGDSLIHIEGIKSEDGKRITIKDIDESPDGKIWLGHTDGISCFNDENVENYYQSDGLISNDVWCIETDAKGQVWIGTIAGVCKFDGQEFTHFDLPEGKMDSTRGISSTQMVHCILEDRQGDIWFCTNAGLFNYSDATLVNVSEQVGIQTNFVNEIVEGDKGEFWISTKEALYKLEGDQLENITKDLPDIGKGIGAVAEDKDGTIWFVFNQHHLYTYDGKDLVQFQKSEDNQGPVIFQIYEDQDDRLWFVGYSGAYRLEAGKFINIKKDGPW